MTTLITTSTTDSQMHNNIMAAGSRDRPPMLATGRYAQWKCILEGPYQLTTVTIPAVPATENSPAVPKRTAVETILTMSPENKAHCESEKEAIHLLLIGIGDEIYSTVDACKTAHEMWIAIERLQQGESLNIQDVKTNLFWEFGKFTSHDGESMESYYSRFYKMMNEMIRNNLTVATMQVNVQFLQQLQPEWSRFVTIVKQQHDLDTVSYHKLFDVLKQYQKEVNEIRAERIAKNANPLALVAAAQQYPDPYYQAPKSHKSFAPPSKQASSTRSNASTKFKGKEIAKPITPPSESASEEDTSQQQPHNFFKPRKQDVELTPRYKNDNQTDIWESEDNIIVGLGRLYAVPGSAAHWIHNFNCQEFGHFAKECRKPKSLGQRSRRFLPADSGTDTEPIGTDEAVLRLLILFFNSKFKLDVDENKKIQKQLKKANASLAHELKECKSTLAKTSRTMGESNSILDSCLIALQNKQTEFERYKTLNDRTIDYDKLEHKLNETLGLLAQQEIVIKEGLKLKAYEISVVKEKHDELVKQSLLTKSLTKNDSFTFVHELKQEMHADLKYVESLENEMDKLESDKAEFSNMYYILLQECVSNDVMCSYLHSLSDLDAHSEL
ncbi:retrovirus-related pol polyprotein from transposon TNT 1-94 [Tanacetum coccineum]